MHSGVERSLLLDAGGAIRATRRRFGWSQAELGRRASLSRTLVGKAERGRDDVTVGSLAALFEALSLEPRLQLVGGVLVGGERQRDPVHATANAYIRRRLEATGWQTAAEVEVAFGRSRGWIDLLGWHPPTRALLVVETKSDYRDHGEIERQLGLYEREAWAAGRVLWGPARVVRSVVLFVWTGAVDVRIGENAGALAAAFRVRAPAVAAWLVDPTRPWPARERAVALVDPRSRRRDWLRPTRLDGRRTAAPYADYADALRALRKGRPRGSG